MKSLFKSYNMEVQSAYVIYLPNNSISVELAERCKQSCEQNNMPVRLFEGFDGTNNEIKVPDQMKSESWVKWLKVVDHHLSAAEVACAMSHIALWAKCMELDQPIVILEHDAIMVTPYLHHQAYNTVSYLGCREQLTNNDLKTLIPPYSSLNKNWYFINRAHAYALDPAAAKKLFTMVLERGIFESLDIMIQADSVAIIQPGFFAYDEPGETTISNRKKDIK